MNIFFSVSCAAILTISLLHGQETQSTSTASQVYPTGVPISTVQAEAAAQPGMVTTTQTVTTQPASTIPSAAFGGQPGYNPANAPITTQPGYQYQNAPTYQATYPTSNPYAEDYSYGQSSVQYAQPILPLKPYIPYSELSPVQNAYPSYPYTDAQANQVNQQFMQRQSQQSQDYLRSQFSYPTTFIDPNAGKPPLGRPIRYSDPVNLSQHKSKGGKNQKKAINIKPKALFKSPEAPTFFFPGMVALTKRLWVGSDYLFYLPSNIGVVIELIADKQIKNDEGKILLEESKLKKIAEDIFKKGGINPQSYSVENAAPLPFFHILIMMYHVDNKVFASVNGRLFEEAIPSRIDLDAPVGTFQAITWEKNELLIASLLQAPEQLELMVTEIAQTFVNGYRFFAEEELDANSYDDLRD